MKALAVVAAIGPDTLGSTVTSALAAAGVDTSPLVIRAGEPTGLTVVLSAGAGAPRDLMAPYTCGELSYLRWSPESDLGPTCCARSCLTSGFLYCCASTCTAVSC